MDLVRGIFKQKIAAFLVFFEVFPEYIQKLCPPRLKITAQVQSLQVILEKGEEGGGGCLHGHQMLKDAGRPRLKLCRYKIEGSELNRHSQTVAIFQKGTSMTNIERKRNK